MTGQRVTNLLFPRSAAVYVAVAVAIVTWLVAASHAWGNTIRLKQQATASGTITIGDIAELSGEETKKLRGVAVAELKASQKTTTVTLSAVRAALSEKEVNWANLSLSGFMKCAVSRASQADASPPSAAQPTQAKGQATENASEPSAGDKAAAATANVNQAVKAGQAATLRQRVKRLLYRMSKADRASLKVTFSDSDRANLNKSVLAKRVELEPRASKALGRVPIAVRAYKGGRIEDRFTVSATVKREVKALVTTQRIDRDGAFTANNTTMKTVWLERTTQPITDAALVEDQRADATLDKGQIVYPDDVKAPTLVKRGQLITVRCITGGLVVRTVARAQEEGARNDRIKVRNESSRETFTCKVTGAREAVVDLTKHQPPSSIAK
jgi:flagella basal body P-ring formation protein FlgA